MNLLNAFIVCICIIPLVFCFSTKRLEKNIGLKCNEENKLKANTCAEKLWFVGRKSRKYPENESQLLKHCKQTASLIKCVKDFTDECGKETQKHLADVMLYTVRANEKSYCSRSNKHKEIFSMSSCGNTIRDETSKCMDEFLVDLGKANAYELRYKVPKACCSFHTMKSCILRSARSVGDPVCRHRAVDNLEKFINSMSGNTLNLMCNEYEEDSDKCEKLPQLAKGVKYSKAPNVIDGFGSIIDN